MFKVKLSSSLAQRNIYHFCVSISLFLLQKTLLFSDLKFIYVHNTTRLKIIEILYVILFNCDKTSKENWISRERLQRPPKQESQRPKANFKGSLRREKKGTTKYRRRLIQLHSERKFNVDSNKALRGRHSCSTSFLHESTYSSSMNGERDKSVGGKKRVGKKNLASTFDLDSTTLLPITRLG